MTLKPYKTRGHISIRHSLSRQIKRLKPSWSEATQEEHRDLEQEFQHDTNDKREAEDSLEVQLDNNLSLQEQLELTAEALKEAQNSSLLAYELDQLSQAIIERMAH